MLSNLRILKNASVRDDYPIFGGHLRSHDKKIMTSDHKNFILMNKELPFEGYINIFVYENLLKKSSEDLELKQEDSKLKCEFDNTKVSLNLLQELNMPFVEPPKDIKMYDLDEETIGILKFASKFVGKDDEYKNVYFGNNLIIATDKQKIFYKETDIDIEPIALSKKIISFLFKGIKIGSYQNNVVVSWEENESIVSGYGLFSTEVFVEYPIDSIKAYINTSKKDVTKLCNMAVIKDAIDKISTVCIGESDPIIEIKNNNYTVEISGESKFNGSIISDYDSEMQDNYSINTYISSFNNISFDYNIFINPELSSNKRLLISNDDSYIFFMEAI